MRFEFCVLAMSKSPLGNAAIPWLPDNSAPDKTTCPWPPVIGTETTRLFPVSEMYSVVPITARPLGLFSGVVKPFTFNCETTPEEVDIAKIWLVPLTFPTTEREDPSTEIAMAVGRLIVVLVASIVGVLVVLGISKIWPVLVDTVYKVPFGAYTTPPAIGRVQLVSVGAPDSTTPCCTDAGAVVTVADFPYEFMAVIAKLYLAALESTTPGLVGEHVIASTPEASVI